MQKEGFFEKMFHRKDSEKDGINNNIPDENSLNPEQHLLAKEESELENNEIIENLKNVKEDSGVDTNPKKY